MIFYLCYIFTLIVCIEFIPRKISSNIKNSSEYNDHYVLSEKLEMIVIITSFAVKPQRFDKKKILLNFLSN